MTVSCTHRAVLRSCWSIAVLDPCSRLFNARAASLDVHRDRRLSTDSARERHELIRAEVAGLGFVLPGEVGPRDTLVTRADAPHPAIVLSDVSARPSDKGGL